MQPGEMPKSMIAVPTDISIHKAMSGVSSEGKLGEMMDAKGDGTPKKRFTECEATTDAVRLETARPPRVLEVWFAGCHCGQFALASPFFSIAPLLFTCS